MKEDLFFSRISEKELSKGFATYILAPDYIMSVTTDKIIVNDGASVIFSYTRFFISNKSSDIIDLLLMV